MNIQPMSDPRPGQAVICVHCSKPIYTDREAVLADLDGVPFKAYYHDACLPLNGFLWWKFVEERGGYFCWKNEDKDGQTVYNVTQTPEPPTNEAGYYSYGYLLKVKGLLNGPTASSILQEWATREGK